MNTALHPVLEAAVALLLATGGVFIAVGAVGLVRLPDFYMRLHAPTKATTLGVGSVLLASMLVHWGQGGLAGRELLVALFLFITAPVSATVLAQAALHLGVPSEAPPPPDIDRR